MKEKNTANSTNPLFSRHCDQLANLLVDAIQDAWLQGYNAFQCENELNKNPKQKDCEDPETDCDCDSPEWTCKQEEPNDRESVQNPGHYIRGGMECQDAMRAIVGGKGMEIFWRLSAIKYLWRYDLKDYDNGILKAIKCLELLLQERRNRK